MNCDTPLRDWEKGRPELLCDPCMDEAEAQFEADAEATQRFYVVQGLSCSSCGTPITRDTSTEGYCWKCYEEAVLEAIEDGNYPR